MSSSTASIAGVDGVPATSTRMGIITWPGFSLRFAAADFNAAPIASRFHGKSANSLLQLDERVAIARH